MIPLSKITKIALVQILISLVLFYMVQKFEWYISKISVGYTNLWNIVLEENAIANTLTDEKMNQSVLQKLNRERRLLAMVYERMLKFFKYIMPWTIWQKQLSK